MTQEELNRQLIRRFPQLQSGYAELKRISGDEEPGSHVVYEDLFVPLIRSTLLSGSATDRADVMDYLETLSESSDTYVLSVLVTAVLEALMDAPVMKQFIGFMGPATSEHWRRMVADFS